MKITLNIPPRLLRDILINANESGTYGAFWLRNYDARIRGDYNGVYIGKPIKGSEADTPNDPENFPNPRAYVGAKALAAGLVAALESKNANFAKAAAARAVAKGYTFRGRNGDASGWDPDGGYALRKEWL